MNFRRVFLLVGCTLVIIAGSQLFVGLQNAGAPGPLSNPDEIRAERLSHTPDTAVGIRTFQTRIQQNPQDAVSLALLGQLYLRNARETGNVESYQRAEAAMRAALELVPDYPLARSGLAATLYAQHDFQNALVMAEEIYDQNPARTEALAILADAHLALGHYSDAEQAYQLLMESSPGPAPLARQAYLSELKGDPDQALQQMEQAAGMALARGATPFDMAWYLVRLGDLHFNRGRLAPAEEYYRAALDLKEDYYVALFGLGKVEAGKQNYDAAITYLSQAAAIIPQPDILAALGDVYILTGQPEEARLQYQTVDVIGQLAAINRQVYNRLIANFYSDHDRHVDMALELALTELEFRRDVYGYDAAAWAYYKNGMFDQADQMMEAAMKLGTRDARLYYHAGMIASAQGRWEDARKLLEKALEINPYFDPLQARFAHDELTRLEAILQAASN